jgi:hypothetical protein
MNTVTITGPSAAFVTTADGRRHDCTPLGVVTIDARQYVWGIPSQAVEGWTYLPADTPVPVSLTEIGII